MNNFTKSSGLVLLLLVAILISGCTKSTELNTGAKATEPTAGNTNANSTAPSSPTVYKLGEKITIGEMSYTVNSMDQVDALGTTYMNKTTEGMFYVVDITIENNGKTEKTIFPSNDFVVIDDKGRTYKPDIELSIYAKTTGFEVLSVAEKISAGLSKTGAIVFEMPKETKGKIKIKPSMFSGEALVEFQ